MARQRSIWRPMQVLTPCAVTCRKDRKTRFIPGKVNLSKRVMQGQEEVLSTEVHGKRRVGLPRAHSTGEAGLSSEMPRQLSNEVPRHLRHARLTAEISERPSYPIGVFTQAPAHWHLTGQQPFSTSLSNTWSEPFVFRVGTFRFLTAADT